MNKLLTLFLAVMIAVLATTNVTHAQTAPACEFAYTVKAGDWLSKIARAYYGEILLYPKIFDATNAADAGTYNHIANPNLIEIGWKVCIPHLEQTKAVQVNYDFRRGAQGWVADFADLPPSQEEFYELQSGIRDLPKNIEPAGTGFFISGNNHSDDLFMFLKRKLDKTDGIQPNTTYSIHFNLVLASNAPSECFGVGGAPGEGVTLKAGGSTIEPKPVDEDGTLRMNVDKGSQTQGGPAGDVVSSIANGIPCDESLNEGSPYASLTRAHTSAYPVKSDANGDLWVMVGTDSGFEATTALYYQDIAMELTPQ